MLIRASVAQRTSDTPAWLANGKLCHVASRHFLFYFESVLFSTPGLPTCIISLRLPLSCRLIVVFCAVGSNDPSSRHVSKLCIFDLIHTSELWFKVYLENFHWIFSSSEFLVNMCWTFSKETLITTDLDRFSCWFFSWLPCDFAFT